MAYTTISKSTDHFNTKTYSGNSGTQNITGIGFQPDMVWTKKRDGTDDHNIFDAVRGVTKEIRPNKSDYEDTASNGLTAFGTDGYTIGDWGLMNQGHTYVSWNWKAGTTSGISAGSQTITPSSYSINTTAGFGIYKWSRTGASTTDYFSHGLGATPTMAIQKRTDGAQDWYVNFTVRDGSNDRMHLNKTDGLTDDSTTLPTATNYYPKSPETGDYVTYLYTPIKGFSKFGKYLGNANADGTFVYTGFKPAFVLLKRIDSGYSWAIVDSKRSTSGFNLTDKYLIPDTNAAEQSASVDLASNGFKLKSNAGGFNGSQIYIYMAFAEAPLVGSNNEPCKAR